MKRLIRFSKRRAAWEGSPDPEQLQQVEFRTKDGDPDLRPSVYEVLPTEEQVVRALAEHAHRIDSDRSTLALDVSEPRRAVDATPGSDRFAFIRDAHREVRLADLADLLSWIGAVLDSQPRAATRRVSREEVRAYVSDRLAAEDPEWLGAAADPLAKRWLRELAAHCR